MKLNKKQRIKKFYEDMNKDYDSLKERISKIINEITIKESNKLKRKYYSRARKEFKL